MAFDFAKGLGASSSTKNQGYIENGSYIITWAVGHLVELYEPGDYNDQWGKPWKLDVLPMIPEKYRRKPIENVKDQLKVILTLLARKDVSSVIEATDAGREGEVIFRTILGQGKYKGPVYRFWSSQALTPKVIQDGMNNLKPASEYDRLWAAGGARQVSDWLIGMNITRAMTLKMGEFFSVGRVQTACVALLVDRLRERDGFKAEPYWILQAVFENPKGTWEGHWFSDDQEKFISENDAVAALNKIQGKTGVVLSVKKEKGEQAPPLLFSLTELQRAANVKYGFSAQHTLDVAQELYDTHKVLSYPRTDSQVMGESNVGMVKRIVQDLQPIYPSLFGGIDHSLISLKNKRVFNNAKLTDHPALTPLAPIPSNASKDEEKLFQLVLERFAAAFYPACKYESTEVVTEVQGEKFITRGRIILIPGWRAVYGGAKDQQDVVLPPLAKDDPAQVVKAENIKKMTTPPPHYTEALLLKDMANPGKYVDEDEYKKVFRGNACGLGTQATRAGIIETILAREYAIRDKKAIIATPKGCKLIDTLRKSTVAATLTSPTETARWEMILDRISKGENITKKFLEGIERFVEHITKELKSMPSSKSISFSGENKMGGNKQPRDDKQKQARKSVGKCPLCGSDIFEGKKGYGCSRWKEGCGMVVWKSIAGTKIPIAVVKKLLKGEESDLMNFMSVKGKPFSARLKVDPKNDGKVIFVFNDNSDENRGDRGSKDQGEVVGYCPGCGGEVVENGKGFGCINWKSGCKFIIWKTVAGTGITKDMVATLLDGDATEQMTFISKKGTQFNAKLALTEEDDNWRVKFIFN